MNSIPLVLFYSSDFVLHRYDEHQLVDAIRQGDHTAFAYLVASTEDMLRMYALQFVDNLMAAEDIVQDVFTRQWIERAKWKLRGSLVAYLRRSVKNRALDVLRRVRKHAMIVHDTPMPNPPLESDQWTLGRELEIEILTIVGRLPFRCRQAFLLCGVANHTHGSAARLMGVSATTVNGYLVEARKRIFRPLREKYPELPTWLTTPEVSFHDTPMKSRTPRTGHTVSDSGVDIDITIDLTSYDPELPLSSMVTFTLRDPNPPKSPSHPPESKT